MVPWWLERPVDFTNHASPFGNYVGGASRLEDPPLAVLDVASAARPPALRRLRRRSRTSTGAAVRAEARRDFNLGLTLLLDDARKTALRWRPNDPSPRNLWLQQPSIEVRDADVQRTRLLVDQWASSQRVLDLFGRIEPLAVAPVYENVADSRRAAGPRLLHGGQGQLLSRLFEQLPAGASVDFGRNALTAAQFAYFRLGSLRDPYALNLADNVVDRFVLRQVLAAGLHSLRHLHCRTGLVLDQGDVDILVRLLSALPNLASLELGLPAFSVAGGGSPGSRRRERPLRYGALYTAELPQLRALYLRLQGQPASDLEGLDLLAYPRLERLGLDVVLTHETLHAWRPVPPSSLAQICFLRTPTESQQVALRYLFAGEEGLGHDFTPHLRGWSSFFERFVSVLHAPTSWSLCRTPPPEAVSRATWRPDSAVKDHGRADEARGGRAWAGPWRSFGSNAAPALHGAAAPGAVQRARSTSQRSAAGAAFAGEPDGPLPELAPTSAQDAYVLYDEDGTTYVFDLDALDLERGSSPAEDDANGASSDDTDASDLDPYVVYGEAR